MLKSMFYGLKSDVTAEHEHVKFLEKHYESMICLNESLRSKRDASVQSGSVSKRERTTQNSQRKTIYAEYCTDSPVVRKYYEAPEANKDVIDAMKNASLGPLNKICSKLENLSKKTPMITKPFGRKIHLGLKEATKLYLPIRNPGVKASIPNTDRSLDAHSYYGKLKKESFQREPSDSRLKGKSPSELNQSPEKSSRLKYYSDNQSLEIYKKKIISKLLINPKSKPLAHHTRSQLISVSTDTRNPEKLNSSRHLHKKRPPLDHHAASHRLPDTICAGEQATATHNRPLSVIQEFVVSAGMPNVRPPALMLDDGYRDWRSPVGKTRFLNGNSLKDLFK